MWKNGNWICEETNRTFYAGETFYYFYKFGKVILTGTIGKQDYKLDGMENKSRLIILPKKLRKTKNKYMNPHRIGVILIDDNLLSKLKI